MATTYPIGTRRYKVTTADHGMFGVLGDVSDREVGLWSVQFVPDTTFVGSLGVVGRIAGKETADDDVGFGSVPYRRVQVGGVASDNAVVSTPITSAGATVLIPASGLSIAFLIECTAGFGYLYSYPLAGHPAF